MNKKLSIFILGSINSLIVLLSIFFGIYSFYFKLSFKILNTNVPGFILALLVLYFGIKNFSALLKLKKEISSDDIVFSWNNFKSIKKVNGKGKRKFKYAK
ncbi:MAG: hypothetical protein Q8900_02655 [Bacillota bacterium]|nr:hypothetical protein [Bacillota bacterium]